MWKSALFLFLSGTLPKILLSNLKVMVEASVYFPLLFISTSWPEIADNATAHAREYLAIWPPYTLRKRIPEIKQMKIERLLVYREQVPWSGLVLERFVANSWQLLFVNISYGPYFSRKIIFEACPIQHSLSQRLDIQYLHPNQILLCCSRRRKRGIPSAAIVWGKATYDVLFDQFSSPMLIS